MLEGGAHRASMIRAIQPKLPQQHGVAGSSCHAHHLAHIGIPFYECPMSAAPHGLGKQVRAVDALGVLEEIAVMRKLDHPNVIRLVETFEDEKTVYLVLELDKGAFCTYY